MSQTIPSGYILGLDLGTNSVGWALVEQKQGQPAGLLAAGSRVFDAGTEGNIESGRDESRGVKRRQARQIRRGLDRRARRTRKLLHLLQGASLLPAGRAGDILPDLDKGLAAKYLPSGDKTARNQMAQVLPYFLRVRALDHKLEPFELGRALYHLGQRRGFKSNRKATRKDEDEGVVKKAISELKGAMEETGARTLGEYLSKLNPHEKRIRARWTARDMYEDEFGKIWAAQAEHHPAVLTPELCKKVRKAIFYQRPLRNQKNLVGFCEFEHGRRRAPWALLDAQRFRLLQRVNDLEALNTSTGEVRGLTDEERSKLLEAMGTSGSVSFGGIRRLLKLRGWEFNLEQGGEKKLPGNRTAARIRKVLGERWDAMSAADRERLVEDLHSIQNEAALARRAERAWSLDPEAARKLATVRLEEGYCALSRKALARLLPLIENGTAYMTAVKQVYGERPAPQPADLLLRVDAGAPDLRNPVVFRALTEMRRVVNAVVRKHGKPALVRVEMGRDLRRGRQRRKQTWQRNRANQREREAAAKRIATEAGIPDPSRADIEKVLLAEECGWICPYTGKPIAMGMLLGANPQFDVEHIIPFSRSLDNSFINKTLCHHEENRNVKRNRTPWEAYEGKPERWGQIIDRVLRFKSSVARAKLARFQLKEVESLEDFSHRQLNDTRYIARKAADFLGTLYGGQIDADGRRRVQAGRGGVTAFLRNEWDLNGILGDGPGKSRDDHRHHAVDAVCIALTSPATVKKLSDAAERAESEGRRRFGKVGKPWTGFVNQVREVIEEINVAHRVGRKVNGPLHEETFYGRERKDGEGRSYRVARKVLVSLKAKDVEKIIDPAVRQRVLDKLAEVGGDPKKLEADPPMMPGGVPVRRVRVRVSASPVKVGRAERERHVLTGSNHHVEILEVQDKKGRAKWEGAVVSTLEAMRRLRAGEQVIRRDHGENKKFVFSLSGGEAIELDESGGNRRLYVVRSVDNKKTGIYVKFVHISDARKQNVKEGNKVIDIRQSASVKGLYDRHCRKVVVTPLGEVRSAND